MYNDSFNGKVEKPKIPNDANLDNAKILYFEKPNFLSSTL